MRVSIILIGLWLMLGLPTSAQAVDPGVKCEAGKLKETGKYGFCLLKAESKGLKKGEDPVITKCVDKFTGKWPVIEGKAGGACPTNGDQAAMDIEIISHVGRMAVLLSGGAPDDCGDGIVGPNESCDWDALAGEDCVSQGFNFGGVLDCFPGLCMFDTSGCIKDKVVFITSTTTSGAIGGLAGGDAICAARAAAAGLSGTFLAWLGDGVNGPSTTFTQSTFPYVRTDGVTVANDWTDLTDSTLINPIDRNEFGTFVPISGVWTGVLPTGVTDVNHCTSWTGVGLALAGLSNAISGDWTNSGGAGLCDNVTVFRLYCFEQ